MDKKELSKWYSEIAKKGHRNNPRPKEFYVAMAHKSAESKRKKKEKNKGVENFPCN
jgi:hypothetical protein